MMVGFQVPSLSVSLSFKRVIGLIMAVLALLAVLPQAWGVAPTFTVANATFPTTAVGKSATQNVTLTVNTAVPITSISIAPDFTEYSIGSISGCTVNSLGTSVVSAGSVCTIAVKYSPAAPGSATSPALGRNAPMLVSDIESGNPVTYAFGLTGSATAAVSQLEPATLSLFAGAPVTGSPAPAQGLGSTTAGYGGNNGPANEALFSFSGGAPPPGCSPYALTQPVARDSAGNLYVIDPGNLVIRKIDNTSDHNVTIVAGVQGKGNTTATFNNAYLDTPSGIAVDAAGNIYFLDTTACYGGFGLVRRVDAVTGAVTSVAGQNFTGTYNTAAGGGTCTGSSNSPSYAWECGDGGLASYASIPYGSQLAIDAAGNLYVWEAGSGGYIRKIDTSTGLISTTASAAQLGAMGGQQGGMTLAADGNFYVSVNTGTQIYIEQFNPNTQAVTQIAGGGTLVGTYCSVSVAQAGYAASHLFLDGTLASSGDLSSDGSGNIHVDEGLCDGSGDILDDAPAVWRINLANGNVFLEAKAGGGAGAEVGYDSYYGYSTSPLHAISDSLGDLYMMTYNQIALLSGTSGALNFTSAFDYTTHPQTLTATYANVGNAAEPNPASSFDLGTNFTMNSTGDTAACSAITDLAIGATCNLDVEFTPVQAGNLTDTLDLTEAGGGMVGLIDNNQTVLLNGTGVAQAYITYSPTAPIAFPATVVGSTSAPQAVTITNSGTANMTIENFFPDGGSFAGFAVDTTTPGTCSTTGNTILDPGTSCTVNVTFTPTSATTFTEYLDVNNTSANAPSLTATEFTGTGLTSAPTPTATLAPNPLAFGGQVLSTTSPAQIVTLSNTGGAALTGIVPTLSGANPGDFALLTTGTNICGATLAAGSSCNIYMTFTPATTGSLPATLSVADNATPSPQSTSLTGTGVQFQANVGQSTTAQAVSVYFATAGTLHTIQVLTQGTSGLDFTVASGGTCATGTAYTAGQWCTVDVIFAPQAPGARNGSILLADSSNNALGTAFLPGTGYGPEIAFEPGVKSTLPSYSGGAYSAPLGVSVDDALNVYVADTLNARIIKIPWNGSSFGTPVNLPAIGLNQPSAVAIDGSGNLFIADTKNNRIVELPWNGTSYGTQVTIDASGLPDPDGIAVDGNGNVYFADGIDQKVVEVPWTGAGYGAPLTISQATGLHSPHGVAVDAAGDLFIADSDNSQVVELPWTSSGFGTEVVVASGLFYPEAVAVDGGGDVYIANSDAATVIELPWDGVSFGTQFTLPFGILGNSNGLAVDANGNIYVADGGNSDVVELNVSNPPTLNFNATNVGSTSSDSPRTVTVYNIGNVDLYFNAQDNNPVYPLDFPINNNGSNLCEEDNSVDQGSSCNVSVNFTPTVSGPLSEDVVLTNNNLNANATQSILVSGSGIGASPTATLTGISFGSVTKGTTSAAMTATLSNTSTTAAMTITGITITGTNGDDFTKTTGTNACGTSLAASSSCLIYATFKPSIVGGESATLNVADNATGSPQTAPLSGSGTAAGAPIATLTPALPFTATQFGQGNQLQATLSNTGTATLTNIAATVTGANGYMFKIYPNGSCYGVTTLAAGASCTISIDFYPPGPGNFQAVLSVTDNAAASPQTSILTGEGTAPNLQFSPGQFDFVAGTPGKLGSTGSGPAISALIGGGYGIALDSTGLLYFSDYDNNTVWQIDDNGNINVFAGTPVLAPGHGSYSGDGAGAAGATLDAPEQIAFDPAGNLYIADRFNNLIRVVDSVGNINTFAGNYGNGFGGYAGDGGAANKATLSSPQGVISDPQGNIYIADTGNFVIRKVDLTGKITLFAGTPGTSGYSGDNGPATSAELGQCYQLATDQNGNLYIADFSNGVVRKVDSAGTITTYAGGGTAVVTAAPQSATAVNLNNGPVGLATDPGGNLYVLGLGESNAPGVFVVNASQQIYQIVGGGSAFVSGNPANAEFTDLNAIAVDASGDLFVDDAFQNVVAEVGPNGDLVFPDTPVNTVSAPLSVTIANTGNAPLAFFNQSDAGVVPGKPHPSASRPTASAHEPHSNVIDFNSYGSIAGPFAIGSGGTCNFDDGIQPGVSCTMNVTFNPTVAGAATGSIFLYTTAGDGGSNSNEVLLAGNGTAASTPTATLSPNLTFPNTNVATTSASLAATLSNTGSGTLTIGNIAIGGTNSADFAIATGSNACGTSLAAAASCSIYVTFTPASAASFSGTLTVTDNASPTTQSVTLSGTGTTPAAPIATLTPTLAFPSILAGSQSTALTATLSNSGNATLNISSIALAGTNPTDFTISTGSNACGATLAADASCSIYVIFNPASVASFTATLNVADNAAGSPQSTSLTGTGLALPDFNISATPATQSIAAGAAATYTVTLNSTNGSFEPNINLTASGLPPGATASFGPAQVSVSDGSAASILTVQTAAAQTAQSRGSVWPFATPALALLLLVPFRRWRRVWRGKLMLLLIGLVSMAAAVTLSACGGGFALVQPSHTYTITVTGTGGTDTHTTTVQLTVQ